jgi:predicted phage terminase large subunit-like protein
MLVTLTRRNEDDLAGRIIEDAKNKGEAWTVVILDAIKSFDNLPVPAEWIYTPDDPALMDTRKAGEALCPERYDLDALAQFQANKYYFSALYQQRPSPIEGALWRRVWFEENAVHGDLPTLGAVGYDWDTAYSRNDQNSATAYVKSGVARDGTIYILDAGFRWVETPAAEAWMIELGDPHFIEGKASGKGLVQRLRLAGRTVIEVQVEGDKIKRVQDVLPEVQAGRVRVAAHVLPLLLDDEKQGILKFPNGSHDDLNDALVQAIKRHRAPRTSTRSIRR